MIKVAVFKPAFDKPHPFKLDLRHIFIRQQFAFKDFVTNAFVFILRPPYQFCQHISPPFPAPFTVRLTAFPV